MWDNEAVDSQHEIPRPHNSHRGLDWQRIARWCFLGTLVMFVWLLSPTVKCAWDRFKDTPLSDLDEDSLSSWESDKERISQGENFVSRWVIACKLCYKRTPLLGQEKWKGTALMLLFAATLISWLLGRRWAHSRRNKFL